MTKSELITLLANRQSQLSFADIDMAVNTLLEHMSAALAEGKRIEIRGFGVFHTRYRPPKIGRNPKTGEPVSVAGKHVPAFKPGKILREIVDK